MSAPDTVIVGGGIAGLATAFYLEKFAADRGQPTPDYVLIEAADRLGGKLITTRIGDFVLEGGPDSFITQKPWGLELCRELGIADQLVPCSSTHTKIYLLQSGKLVPFPRGLRLGVPTEVMPFLRSPMFSLQAKLRMGLELFVPRRRAETDESVGAFMRRRLGREAAQRIAGPMMAGIYVSDPERMSILSTFPMFPDMEKKHGSLIRAMLSAKRARRKSPQPTPAMFMSPRGGMQDIVEALVPRLSGKLSIGTSVTGIQRRETGFAVDCSDGTTLAPRQLVLATPAFASSELLHPLQPALAERLDAIRYVATALVVLAFEKDDFDVKVPFDGYGFLAPKDEATTVIACTWSSLKFSHRAPEGAAVIRAFVGGANREANAHLDNDELIRRVRADLAAIMGLKAKPIQYGIYRWPRGNPQYDVGHRERIAEIEALTRDVPGLHLTGSAYRGIGVPDCIKDGMQTAEALIGTPGDPAADAPKQ